ncbi:envelope stress response membrane protein PspB [Temperatibacter marinus]|uniref:Envelope stress response membrane protein PspB n=1 Tax=Temperatibacter marinus TaxID=1456591 RepID=A0AA52EJD3_9PROT|nr:envelope stress response membrane protein PspB [Temperatibacter marinus]WND03359.1 envelope stress response membrane protein PspB [Temperatibacter marinus]
MEDVFVILILTCVVPLWIIFHYITKWKQMKVMSPDDENTFGDMHRVAEKLENRINTLERILDSENPGWRSKYHDHS